MPRKIVAPIGHLLLRATRNGVLDWRFLSDTHARLQDGVVRAERVGVPLVTDWKEHTFRIYEYSARFYSDEDNFDIVPSVALELVISYGGEKLSDLPTQNGWELLHAARKQAAKLDELANSLDEALGGNDDE